MTFLHPWAFWTGLAVAAGLPVAIHLLTRPRPVRMPLSTLRFVREAIRQRRARHRLRDLIVLVLRTAAIMLLALAIARPQWGAGPLASEGQSGEAVRVVVLDVSQSMGATVENMEAIERAKTRAADFLQYRSGLRANLILAGARPSAVFDEPSTNFEALRDALDRAEALPQRVDVAAALSKADGMLRPRSEDDTRRRELVIISDFQRANWAPADFSQIAEGTDIHLESVASSEPLANLAVLRADCRSQGAQAQTVQLEIEIGNFTATTREVSCELTVGEETYNLTGTCPAGETTTLSETIQLRGVGWQAGRARLMQTGRDDALAADDERPLVARVRPRPVFALVTRQPAGRTGTSSHYLDMALVPDAWRGDGASARVTRVDPAGLDGQTLAPADLIVIDHPGMFSDDAINLLAGLLRRGRPILYAAAELIDAENLQRLADRAGSDLQLPVQFLPPPAGQLRQNLFLTSVRRDAAPFRVFGDEVSAVVSPLRFAGGLSSRRIPGTLDDDLLAQYSDGTACLVFTRAGAGALAVLNADLGASNVPHSRAAFVPLVQELVGRLLQRGSLDREFHCGEQLTEDLDSDVTLAAGLLIFGAGDAEGEASGGRYGELSEQESGVRWNWDAPSSPGVYRVRREDATLFAAAVTVPPEESRLETIPANVLRERQAAGRDVSFRSATGEGESDEDVWKWFAAACVLAMLAEIGALLAFRT